MELGLGIDLLVTLFQRLRGSVGVGFNYWNSTGVDGVTRDSGGNVVNPRDELSFRGNDLYVRLSLGFMF